MLQKSALGWFDSIQNFPQTDWSVWIIGIEMDSSINCYTFISLCVLNLDYVFLLPWLMWQEATSRTRWRNFLFILCWSKHTELHLSLKTFITVSKEAAHQPTCLFLSPPVCAAWTGHSSLWRRPALRVQHGEKTPFNCFLERAWGGAGDAAGIIPAC